MSFNDFVFNNICKSTNGNFSSFLESYDHFLGTQIIGVMLCVCIRYHVVCLQHVLQLKIIEDLSKSKYFLSPFHAALEFNFIIVRSSVTRYAGYTLALSRFSIKQSEVDALQTLWITIQYST